MFNIGIGEVIFGGVGVGLIGMLFYVILSMFIAGLMIGRTPEFMGKKFGPFVQATLAYNIARYVEFLATCERAVELLGDPAICGKDIRTPVAAVKARRGVGIVEAPRGTLIHDYTVNEQGFIEKCNLIVATCQNNYAMDRSVEDVARRVVQQGALTPAAANRIEQVIRAYDPCISCATHAIGKMPIRIELEKKPRYEEHEEPRNERS
jgi:F420-non-reducing hydrogenase large subunit